MIYFQWFLIQFKWCYKCHKVIFRCDGLYIDSPDWIKKKKASVNPKNIGDKCFQYVTAAAVNYGEIMWNPERVLNIEPFINKYHWKGINYPSKIDDWKTFEKNNLTIAFNIFYIKGKEICSACISKINLNCENQISILMIPNEEKEGWNCLAVKKLCIIKEF